VEDQARPRLVSALRGRAMVHSLQCATTMVVEVYYVLQRAKLGKGDVGTCGVAPVGGAAGLLLPLIT
jgi:hypothetical protein